MNQLQFKETGKNVIGILDIKGFLKYLKENIWDYLEKEYWSKPPSKGQVGNCSGSSIPVKVDTQ